MAQGDNNKSIIGPALIIIALVLAFILVQQMIFLGKDYLSFPNTAEKNSAITECAKISKYEKKLESDSAVVSYPILDVYKKCLHDKGINN